MKAMKRSFLITLMVAIVIIFSVSTTSFAATKLKLNCTKATIGVDNVITLSVNAKKAKWKSSNTKVAAVNKNGVVTGVKSGKVTVTAKANGKTAKCRVTVKNYLTDSQAAQLIASGVLTEDSVKQIVKDNSLTTEEVIKLIKQNSNNTTTIVSGGGLSQSEVQAMINDAMGNNWTDGTDLTFYNSEQMPITVYGENLEDFTLETDPTDSHIEITSVKITKYRDTSVILGHKQKYRYHVEISGVNYPNSQGEQLRRCSIVYLRSDGAGTDECWYPMTDEEIESANSDHLRSNSNLRNCQITRDGNNFTFSCDQYNMWSDYDEFLMQNYGY
jgi:hypothetical protein